MENTNLLNDTIIAEALAYDDEFEPVVIVDPKMFPGKVIDTMNEFEKRLYSLYVIKNRETGNMFSNILGNKSIDNSKNDNIKELSSIISYNPNLHYYEKFNKLQDEAEACIKLMWILINLRVKSDHSVLSIQPGFKIVALRDTNNFLTPGVGWINFS